MNDGAYVVYDEKTPYDKISRAILASAAIPFVFPNVQMDGHVLMDGGAVWNMNFVTAINKCKEIEGITDNSQIIMDVVSCSPTDLLPENTTDVSNAGFNFLRYYEIGYHYEDIYAYDFMRANPTVQYRYFFGPTVPLEVGYML